MMVVLVRLKSSEELIGIFNGEHNGKIKIIHPHYIKYNSNSGTLGMMPYCPLSDEIHFEYDKDRIEFLVTTKDIVKHKFLDMISDDSPEEDLPNKEEWKGMFVEGNDTKH